MKARNRMDYAPIARLGAGGMSALRSLKQRMRLSGKTAVIAGPYTWLLLLFFVPFLLVVKISFSDARRL
jgi:hypothetical protein